MNDREVMDEIVALMVRCGLHVHGIEMRGSPSRGTFQIALVGSDRPENLLGHTDAGMRHVRL